MAFGLLMVGAFLPTLIFVLGLVLVLAGFLVPGPGTAMALITLVAWLPLVIVVYQMTLVATVVFGMIQAAVSIVTFRMRPWWIAVTALATYTATMAPIENRWLPTALIGAIGAVLCAPPASVQPVAASDEDDLDRDEDL